MCWKEMKRQNARLNLCVARHSMYCKETKRKKMDKRKMRKEKMQKMFKTLN
jgi:hypothetical protein